MTKYAIRLEQDDNGTWLATCRDFPELTTFGDTPKEALMHASDALAEAIAARLDGGEDVPQPSAPVLAEFLAEATQ